MTHDITPQDALSPERGGLSERAAQGIGVFSQELITKVRNGSLDKKLQFSDTILPTADEEQVTDREFATQFMEATNIVALSAQQLLKRGESYTELVTQRNALMTQYATQPRPSYITDSSLADPRLTRRDIENPQTQASLLEEANRIIRSQILEIVKQPNSLDVSIRALNLAIMMVEHEERDLALAERLVTQREQVAEHVTLMRQARELARNPFVQEQYRQQHGGDISEHEVAFLTFLDLKLRKTGRIPSLVTLHDVNGNLLNEPVEDGSKKPGNAIGSQVNPLHQLAGTPVRQNLQLTDSLQRDPIIGRAVEWLLEEAGRSTKPMFKDAKEALELGVTEGISTILLTANMKQYAEGIIQRLDIPIEMAKRLGIWGMDTDSFVSQEKPRRILEAVLSNLDGVTLFSDDVDRRTVETLIAGSLHEFDDNVSLEDIIFLAARSSQKLAQTLGEKDILFSENSIDPTHQELGYQGTLRLMQMYVEWRKNREADFILPANERLLDRLPMHIQVLLSSPDHTEENKYLLDGSINGEYYIGGGTSVMLPDGKVAVLYKGTEGYINGRKACANVGLAVFSPDRTLLTQDFPILKLLPGDEERFPHGLEDSRITYMPGFAELQDELGAIPALEGLDISKGLYVIVSNASNKFEVNKGAMAERGRGTELKGCYIYVHVATDPSDPSTYRPIGQIGPDRYLKNAMMYPDILNEDGTPFTESDRAEGREPHIGLIYRELPGIQMHTVPVRNLFDLPTDPDLKHRLWAEALSRESVKRDTILTPRFAWEAHRDPLGLEGQIAGGAAPFETIWIDPGTGKRRKVMVMVYNSVSEFLPDVNQGSGTLDRLVGIALLDPNNPRTVLARYPFPLINPHEFPAHAPERNGRRGVVNVAFATGAFIDNNGKFHVTYTGGDQNVTVAVWESTQEVISTIMQYDAQGHLRY